MAMPKFQQVSQSFYAELKNRVHNYFEEKRKGLAARKTQQRPDRVYGCEFRLIQIRSQDATYCSLRKEQLVLRIPSSTTKKAAGCPISRALCEKRGS